MKAKKIVTAGLAAMMAMAMTVPVFAASSTQTISNTDANPTSATVTVDYVTGTSSSYTVIIPADVTLTSVGKATSGGSVQAKDVLLLDSQKLVVTVSSANGFSLNRTNNGVTSQIPYTMTAAGSAVAEGSEVLHVETGATSGTSAIKYTATNLDSVKIAGDHADTLTFTVTNAALS